MAGISFGGISSGLDTAAIVNQLMSVESNPQILLKQKLSKQNAVVTALQGLNSRVASLATNAAALAKPEAWTKAVATSSSASVTAAGSTGSGAGTLTFDVTRLAQRASWTTAPITDGATTGPQSLTLTPSSGGAPVSVTATSGNAVDLAKAINGANAGVTATAVRTGTDAAGASQFRLLVTAANSGAAGDFTLSGDAPGATRLAAGQDAEITLGPGTTVTSPSNTFADLMSGVAVTVTKLEQGVTVTSAPDVAGVAKQAAGVIGSLGVVLSEISAQSRSTPGSAGPLAGSSLLRGLQQELAGAVSAAVPGATLADLGIQLTRAGAVTIDEKAFAAFAVKEPEKAKALTTAFAGALATVAKTASEAGTGTISQAVTSGQSTVKDIGTGITRWDDRLALRRSSLERQFASLEVALSKSKATGSYLSGALAGAPAA